MSISFTKLGKFFVVIFSNRFPVFCSHFFFWYPHDVNVGMLEVVPEALYTILIFFGFFFLLVVLIGCFLIPHVPNH